MNTGCAVFLQFLFLACIACVALPLAGEEDASEDEETAKGTAEETAGSLSAEVVEELTALAKRYESLEFYEHELKIFREGGVPTEAAGLLPCTAKLTYARPGKIREEYDIETARTRMKDGKTREYRTRHTLFIVCNGEDFTVWKTLPVPQHVSKRGDKEFVRREIRAWHPLRGTALLDIPSPYSTTAYKRSEFEILTEKIPGLLESKVETKEDGGKVICASILAQSRPQTGGQVREMTLLLTIHPETKLLSRIEMRVNVTVAAQPDDDSTPSDGNEAVEVGSLVCDFSNVRINRPVGAETFSTDISPESEAISLFEAMELQPPKRRIKSLVGRTLPALGVVDCAGKTTAPASLRSKIVVLIIGDIDQEVARHAAAGLDAIYPTIAGQGVEALFVTSQNAERTKAFGEELKLTIPLFPEQDEKFAATYLMEDDYGDPTNEWFVRCIIAKKGGEVIYDQPNNVLLAELRSVLREQGVVFEVPGKPDK